MMIRFFINELLSEKQFKAGRKVTLVELSEGDSDESNDVIEND